MENDYLNGDHSFKQWFKIMWSNHYIQYFIVFLTVLILQLVNFKTVWGWLMDSYAEGLGTGLFVTPFMFIPIAGTLIIAYKGFYQFWDDLKHGRSR